MPTKHLILRVTSDNDLYDGDCSSAYLALTPELARLALKRIELFNQLKTADSSIVEINYWDYHYHVDYFRPTGELEEVCYSDRDITELDEALVIPENLDDVSAPGLARTECDQMSVDDSSVRWTAIPKHCDFYVRTSSISVETLKEAATS